MLSFALTNLPLSMYVGDDLPRRYFANKQIVEKYFSDAINNLLSEDNGFAIKTLALPIVQCYGLVNNRNEYHARYNQIVEQLQRQSQSFASYVKSSDVLQSITNKEDLWQRALSLPFIYS